GVPAWTHRLDEYLQGAIVSVAKDRVEVKMTLTPGVIVAPALLADLDADANGSITPAEQRAYSVRVLKDLSLVIDGHRIQPRLTSLAFPSVEDMKAGTGEIHLTFEADLPPGGRHRQLTL